jgi:hypothetical protein
VVNIAFACCCTVFANSLGLEVNMFASVFHSLNGARGEDEAKLKLQGL